MGLIKFKDFLGGKGDGKSPPSVIRAADLDNNFKMLQLIEGERAIYKVNSSDKGQSLTFTAGNMPVYWYEIAVCVDGAERKMMVLGTEPY